jgi:hypothetical protein
MVIYTPVNEDVTKQPERLMFTAADEPGTAVS